MKAITNIARIYFIGIGGIGMSALARYFNSVGVKVSGYDKTPSPLTAQLQKEGINITFEDIVETIDKSVDWVVYTPAIPKSHVQLNWYKQNEYPILKRSQVLGKLSKEMHCIAVAGSHGKTTISSMITHLLNQEMGCTAFLGGITKNYQSNYIKKGDDYLVVEADEYDRSFMTLFPNYAIITAIDSDHLEIYGSLENIEKEFIAFANQIQEGGTLLINEKYQHVLQHIRDGIDCQTYGYDNANDAQLLAYRVEKGNLVFDLNIRGERITAIKAGLAGIHNVENALAAISVAKNLGVSNENIKKGMESFQGILRRFDKQIEKENIVYIDDYAHHPKEVEALMKSVRFLYPNKKIIAFFQPHLFSRTKDLHKEFAAALDLADEIYLLPIYPARELPIEGISSDLITTEISNNKAQIIEKEKVVEYIQQNIEEGVVLTIGAGDIDRLVPQIKEVLNG